MALEGTIGQTVILTHNFYTLPNVVVIDPTQLSDEFAATNLRDDKDYLLWRPASSAQQIYQVDLGDGTGGTPGPLEPTYLAFIGHNMGSKGVTWTIEGGDDGITWPFSRGTFSFDDDLDWASVFPEGPGGPGADTRRYWRLLFDGMVDESFISEIFFGQAVEFEQLPQPGFNPQLGRPIYEQSSGEVGVFVDEPTGNNVIRQVRFTFEGLTAEFINNPSTTNGLAQWFSTVGLRGKPAVVMWNAGTPGFFRVDILFGPIVRGITEAFETGLDSFSDLRTFSFSVIGKKKKRIQTIADYSVLV